MNETFAEALMIENGTIKKVGMLRYFEEEWADVSIEKEDLKEITLLPGFVDPHGHISMMGTMSVMANLRDCDNFEDIVNVLTTYIEENKIKKGNVDRKSVV